MRGLALSLGLVLWASAACSQTVEVRGGEHDTFTRLVFRLPERQPYRVERSDDEARLVLESSGLEYETASVFQRVPRTRLMDISASEDGSIVRLALSCGCETRSFWYGDASLVIDIMDPEDQVAAARSDRSESRDAPRPDADEDRKLPETLAGLRYATNGSTAADLVAQAMSAEGAAGSGTQKHKDDPQTLPTVMRINPMDREALAQAIGRAMDHGLVSPAEPGGPSSAGEIIPDAPSVPANAETRPNPRANIHVRAQTAIERAFAPGGSESLYPATPGGCTPADALDMSGWSDGRPFHAQVGALRRAVMSELDTPEPGMSAALVKLYLYFGFGAEARHTLSELAPNLPETALLATLADIVEHGFTSMPSLLSGQLECAPATALWSALSYRHLPEDEPVDTEAILRGFNELPPQLRAHLGPQLAKRFLDAGYRSESDKVYRILSRSRDTLTPDARIVGADLTLADGEDAEAAQVLDELVAENTEPSGEALVRLISLRLSRGEALSYETAQLAGAYALEQRGVPESARYEHAHLSALAASGAYDEAFATFEKTLTDNEEQRAETLSTIAGLLAENASDFDFLKHALSGALDEKEALSAEVALKIAKRLMDLGFHDDAAEAAQAASKTRETTESRLLRADIAMRLGEPWRALEALEGLEGAEALALRARALGLAGEHDAAAALFDQVGLEADADREAWLGLDMDRLGRQEGTPIAEIARQRAAERTGNPVEGEKVLQRALGMADESAELRATLDALLEANPLPDAER